jgi:hypothetical protein
LRLGGIHGKVYCEEGACILGAGDTRAMAAEVESVLNPAVELEIQRGVVAGLFRHYARRNGLNWKFGKEDCRSGISFGVMSLRREVALTRDVAENLVILFS